MRQARAINVNDWLVGIGTQIVNDESQQVFTCAALTANEQGTVGLGKLSGLFDQPKRHGVRRNILRKYRRGFWRPLCQEAFLFFLLVALAPDRRPGAGLLLAARTLFFAFFGAFFVTAAFLRAAGFAAFFTTGSFSRLVNDWRRADFQRRSKS